MSNLGFHFDANQEHGGQFEKLLALPPGHLAAVTVIVNPNDPGKAAAAINSAAVRVLRLSWMEDAMSGSDGMGEDPVANAKRAVEYVKPFLGIYPGAYWQWYRNEIADWSKVEFYVTEMIAWCEALHALGALASIGGFSFGTPDYPVWPKLEPAMAVADMINLHEYGVYSMYSALDPDRTAGHHCLRYRKVWKLNNYWQRFPNLRIHIGECGLDEAGDGSGQGGPWRRLNVQPSDYLRQLNWYDGEISTDGVTGTVYLWDASAGWEEYDVDGEIADTLLERIAASFPNLKQSAPPAPEPPPLPPPVELDEVLLDENFDRFASWTELDDRTGDRKIPLRFEFDWRRGEEFGIPHVEFYPPDAIADTPDYCRVHCTGKINGWLYRHFVTTPGDEIKVTARARMEILGDGAARWEAVIDPAGGDDPTLPDLPRVAVSGEEEQNASVSALAKAGTVTVFWRIFHKNLFRVNFDLNRLTVLRHAGAVEPPPEPEPDSGRRIITDRVKLRSSPVYERDGENVIAEIEAGTVVQIEGDVISGPVWKYRKIVAYVAEEYLKRL